MVFGLEGFFDIVSWGNNNNNGEKTHYFQEFILALKLALFILLKVGGTALFSWFLKKGKIFSQIGGGGGAKNNL